MCKFIIDDLIRIKKSDINAYYKNYNEDEKLFSITFIIYGNNFTVDYETLETRNRAFSIIDDTIENNEDTEI